MRSALKIMRFPGTALALPICAAVVPSVAYALPPFKHIVIIIQENRTPDNIFGSKPTFEPGVDLATTGTNSSHGTVTLTAETLNSCYDIDHSHTGFENAFKEGFDKDQPSGGSNSCTIPTDPQFKYVDNSNSITLSTGQTLTHTVQPYFDIAENYGFANRMFQSNQGPSFPAHQFLFGGTSAPSAESDLFASENMNGDQGKGGTNGAAGCAGSVFATSTVNQINPYGVETGKSGYEPPPAVPPCFEHPVLADLLSNSPADLSWRYYAENPNGIWTAPNAIQHLCSTIGTLPSSQGTTLCTSAPWTLDDEVVTRFTGNSAYGTLLGTAQIFKDIEACNLPSVTWVTPTGEASDHSGVSDGTGPQWVGDIVNAIGTQTCSSGETYWNDTAIIITWDDWGGWFDHVTPFKVNVLPPPPPLSAGVWGDGYTYGFRVPMLVVSAYTPAGFVGDTESSGGTITTIANHDFGTILYFVEQVFGLGFIGDLNPPGTYSQYADYAASSRGDLHAYFSLGAPKAFVPIKTQLGPSYFESLSASYTPVDTQ